MCSTPYDLIVVFFVVSFVAPPLRCYSSDNVGSGVRGIAVFTSVKVSSSGVEIALKNTIDGDEIA